MTTKITNQRDLRRAFWAENPYLRYRDETALRRLAPQNDQPCDTRVAWCDWLDAAVKDGRASAALAERATL